MATLLDCRTVGGTGQSAGVCDGILGSELLPGRPVCGHIADQTGTAVHINRALFYNVNCNVGPDGPDE